MNNNLPVPKKSNFISNLQNASLKVAKVLCSSLATVGFGMLTMGSIAMFWPLAIPSTAAFAFSAQKLLNNTLYKSYKDLAFITRKNKGNMKIFQDILRPDIFKHIRGLTDIEKAGFMQLQAIVGMSKFSNIDKDGNPIKFETDSHGITQKTLKTLSQLGYITDYQENFLRTTHLIGPKLAFGNGKITDKVDLYNIKFQLPQNKIDINDSKLQKAFPLVFSKRHGILANYNYNIINNPDGSLSIDYNAKNSFIQKAATKSTKFQDILQKGAPTQLEQSQFIQDRTVEQKTEQNIKSISDMQK